MGAAVSFFDDPIGNTFDAVGDFVSDPIGFVSDLWEDTKDEFRRFMADLLDIPDPPEGPAALEGTLLNYSGGGQSIPVVYGQRRVGGVFAAPPLLSGAKNEYVHLFLVVSEGPIGAIGNVYFDDVDSTDARFSGLVRVNKHLGEWAQAADADAVAELSEWTTDHRLAGLAYVYVRLKWNRDAFGRIPSINVDVDQGRLVYNAATDTTGYSANPAWVVRDYLTDTVYGKGLPAARIDDASFIAAAAYWDTPTQPYSGSASLFPRAQCNGVVDTARPVRENVRDLAENFAAEVEEIGGLYALQVDRDLTPAMALTEDDIFGVLRIGDAGRRQRWNRVRGAFADESRNYETYELVQDSTTFRAEDAGRVQETKLTLRYSTDRYQVDRLLQQALRASRATLGVTLLASARCLALTRGDIVTLDYPAFGISGETFRVGKPKLSGDGLVGLPLVRHIPSAYSILLGQERPVPPVSDLPNPWSVAAPTNVTAESGTDHLLLQSDGTVVARVLVSWTASTHPFVDHYRVEWSPSGGTLYRNVVIVGADEADEAYLTGLPEGTPLWIRVRAVNTLGVTSPNVGNSTTHTVVGKSAAPSDVTGYTVSVASNALLHEWTPVADLDVREYEIRQGGSDWATATLVTRVKGASYTDPNLPDVTTVYRIKAVDTSGNESAAATSATRTVTGPGDASAASATLNGAKTAVLVAWTAAPENTFAIDHYEVRKGGTGWADAAVVGTVSGAVQLLDTALPATSTTYRVKGFDLVGNESAAAATVAFTVNAPGAPTGLVSSIDADGTSVTLEWTTSAGTYDVTHTEVLRASAGDPIGSAVLVGRVDGNTLTREQPIGHWTYYVRHVDVLGTTGSAASVDRTVTHAARYRQRLGEPFRPSFVTAGDEWGTACAVGREGQIAACSDAQNNVLAMRVSGGVLAMQLLTPQTTAVGFGATSDSLSMSKSGDRLAVGDSAANNVHVYRHEGDSYVAEQLITGAGPAFGVSVAMDGTGETLAIRSNAQVLVYRRSGTAWTLADTITVFGATPYGLEISYDGLCLALQDSLGDTRIFVASAPGVFPASATQTIDSAAIFTNSAQSGISRDGARLAVITQASGGAQTLQIWEASTSPPASYSLAFSATLPTGENARAVRMNLDGTRVILLRADPGATTDIYLMHYGRGSDGQWFLADDTLVRQGIAAGVATQIGKAADLSADGRVLLVGDPQSDWLWPLVAEPIQV